MFCQVLALRDLPLQGDWAEMVSTFGFPSWADHRHPCWMCLATHLSMALLDSMSLLEWPSTLVTPAMYDESCSKCEHLIVVWTREQLDKLVANLVYDKSNHSKSSRGRKLVRDLPEWGLLKNDRLEPTIEVWDINDLKADNLPISLVFWRRVSEYLSRHRNPLFRDPYVASMEVIAVDEMHTMHLGLYNFYVAFVFHHLIAQDVFQVGGGSQEHKRALAVARLRSELWDFYRERALTHPGEPDYRIADLYPAMISEFGITTKAAETSGLLPFAVKMVARYPGLRNQPSLLGAGIALLKYHKVTRNSPRRLSPSQRQDSLCQTSFVNRKHVSGASAHTADPCGSRAVAPNPLKESLSWKCESAASSPLKCESAASSPLKESLLLEVGGSPIAANQGSLRIAAQALQEYHKLFDIQGVGGCAPW